MDLTQNHKRGYPSASLVLPPGGLALIGDRFMYAVIQTGGKQYRVAAGDTLRVEKLAVEPGTSIEFQVLLISDGETHRIGRPYVPGSKVLAEVQGHGRGKKIKIIKFKRRKHHMKRQGHRQDFTELRITDIQTG